MAGQARKKARSKPRWEEIEFSSDDLKYDPQEFYVPPADAHGHSVPRTFRVAPALSAEIDLIVQNFGKLCGWKTAGDFLRYATNYQVLRLHAMEPSMPRTFLGGLIVARELAMIEKHQTEMEGLFISLAAQVQKAIDRGDHHEASNIIHKLWHALQRCEDRTWRDKFNQRYMEQYRAYLQPGSAGATSSGSGPNGRARPGAADSEDETLYGGEE